MPAEPIDNDLGTALPGGQADAPKIPTSPDPGAQQIPEDLSGGSLADADVALPTAGEALDALHEEALKEEANKAAEIVKDPPKPKPKPKPPAAEEGVGDGSEPDPDPKDATEDDVESLTFPENSSSKAREQFEKLKTLSRERVQAAETIAKKADEELKALKSKLGGKSADEIQKSLEAAEKELAELREFRSHVDIETAPEFQAFDKRISRNSDTILKKLEEWGMTKENVEKIRTNGVAKIDWDAIFEHMTPQQKRFVETRLLDIENAVSDKEEAVSEAKLNSQKFLKERADKQGQEAEAATSIRLRTAETLESGAAWLKDPELPKDATKEQKSDYEGSVKFLAAIREKLRISLEDVSPEMHATLAYGNAMALYLRANVDYLARELEASQKQAEEATSQLEKIRKASRSKRPDRPTLEGGSRQTQKPDSHRPGMTAEEALDSLYAEAQANDQNA